MLQSTSELREDTLIDRYSMYTNLISIGDDAENCSEYIHVE